MSFGWSFFSDITIAINGSSRNFNGSISNKYHAISDSILRACCDYIVTLSMVTVRNIQASFVAVFIAQVVLVMIRFR